MRTLSAPARELLRLAGGDGTEVLMGREAELMGVTGVVVMALPELGPLVAASLLGRGEAWALAAVSDGVGRVAGRESDTEV